MVFPKFQENWVSYFFSCFQTPVIFSVLLGSGNGDADTCVLRIWSPHLSCESCPRLRPPPAAWGACRSRAPPPAWQVVTAFCGGGLHSPLLFPSSGPLGPWGACSTLDLLTSRPLGHAAQPVSFLPGRSQFSRCERTQPAGCQRGECSVQALGPHSECGEGAIPTGCLASGDIIHTLCRPGTVACTGQGSCVPHRGASRGQGGP